MCLDQLTILNPRKQLVRNAFQPVVRKVACGKCPECRDRKSREWEFRTYWEAKDTWRSGGYRLFDTYTYRRELRPKISDFVPEFKNSILDYDCFNYEHWKRFTIDVRNYLKRQYGIDPELVKGSLKYICCTEYGTTEGRDHAPHIHVLWDVKGSLAKVLRPEDFSLCLNECWSYGRTDGLHYIGACVVPWDGEKNPTMRIWRDRHVFYQDRDLDGMKISRYIMKYMVKQSSFQSVIDKRLDILKARVYSQYLGYKDDDFGSLDEFYDYAENSWLITPELEDKLKDIEKHVSQFTRVSHHYGESAMEFYDKNEVAKDGYFVLPDDEVKFRFPVAQYYVTKWFYEKYVTKNKDVVWRITDEGKEWKRYNTWRNVANMANEYKKYFEQYFYDVFEGEERESVLDDLEKWFDERGYRDLAIYEMFYHGRMIPEDESLLGNNGEPRFSPKEIIELDILSSDPKFLDEVGDKYRMIYAYNTKSDRRHFGGKFYSKKWLGCKTEWDSFLKSYKLPRNRFLEERDKIKKHLDSLKIFKKKNGEYSKAALRWLGKYQWFGFYDENILPEIPEGYAGCDYIDYVLQRWQRSYCQRHSDYCKSSQIFSVLHSVNENTYYKFHDFDKILEVYDEIRKRYGKKKIDEYNEKIRQQELFKYKNIKYRKL